LVDPIHGLWHATSLTHKEGFFRHIFGETHCHQTLNLNLVDKATDWLTLWLRLILHLGISILLNRELGINSLSSLEADNLRWITLLNLYKQNWRICLVNAYLGIQFILSLIHSNLKYLEYLKLLFCHRLNRIHLPNQHQTLLRPLIHLHKLWLLHSW